MTTTRVVDSFQRVERVKYYTVQYKRYGSNTRTGLKSYVWETVRSVYANDVARWDKRRDARACAALYTKEHNVDTQVIEHVD